MKVFEGGAPLRLSLPLLVGYEGGWHWAATLADKIDDAGLTDHFRLIRHEIAGDSIRFYLQTSKRKSELAKQLRHDKNWLALLKEFPDAQLEWADEVQEVVP